MAAVSMCIQFRSYLRGAKLTLRTDHKSLVWLHQFKDTEGMMARWLHALQQFQFSIIHRSDREYGNADGLSRALSSPCRQCTRPDCPTVDTKVEVSDQPFDAESLGDSEDADLVPVQSGEDRVAQLDDDLSRPASQAGELFRISPPCSSRIISVSQCWSGSGRILFLHGRRLSHCVRNCDFCGTTGITYQRTRMEWHGGSGAPIVINFNYWYRRQEDRHYFWPITLHCLGVIWAGPARWPA